MGENTGAKPEDNDFFESITPEDIVLTILYAQKDKPLTGKLMFVKQVFLFTKEIVPGLDDKMKFFPYSFGPYSSKFAQVVNKLINDGIIGVEKKVDDDREIYRFSLTEKGLEKAEKSFNKFPEKVRAIIKRKRRGWDQLGYTGIVRLVYTKYPEYIVNSSIKDEVEND